MDFTLEKYRELLIALKDYGKITLRHDVDLKPQNSLATARIENELGWPAVYYFRAVPESWDESIILEIQSLGHEIGYHYESLTTCSGDVDAAWEDFKTNLEKLSQLIGKPVRKICMHGSPRSPWDSKDIWKKYGYKTLGVEFEPYIDTDFSKTFYLTDTGRRWDGYKVSVRDRIPVYQDQWISEGLVFHTTDDIIDAARRGILPAETAITTHPQRWTSSVKAWCLEYCAQSAKNVIKRTLILIRRIRG